MSQIRLMYFNSDSIVRFVEEHPIDWMQPWRPWAVKRGCIADQAGVPPIANVEVFFALLSETKALFPQKEYFTSCINSWGEQWIESLKDKPIRGGESILNGKPREPGWTDQQCFLHALRVKAYRNFYPSCLDSLHVWSLLVEWGNFDECVLDVTEDVIGHTDITVKANGETYPIALHSGIGRGQEWLRHKQQARGAPNDKYVITFHPDSSQGAGGKRWYTPEDVSRSGLPFF